MKSNDYNNLIIIPILIISIIIHIFPPIPAGIEYSDVLLFVKVLGIVSFSITGIFIILYCINSRGRIIANSRKLFMKIHNIRNRIPNNPRKIFISVTIIIIVATLLYIFRWEYSYATTNRVIVQFRRNIYTGTTQYRSSYTDGIWRTWDEEASTKK